MDRADKQMTLLAVIVSDSDSEKGVKSLHTSNIAILHDAILIQKFHVDE